MIFFPYGIFRLGLQNINKELLGRILKLLAFIGSKIRLWWGRFLEISFLKMMFPFSVEKQTQRLLRLLPGGKYIVS